MRALDAKRAILQVAWQLLRFWHGDHRMGFFTRTMCEKCDTNHIPLTTPHWQWFLMGHQAR